MFSVRNTLFLAAVATFFCQGCERKANSAPNVSAEPHQIDAAMALRDWPKSTAYISNGAAVAGSTGFAYEPKPGLNKYRYYYIDTGVLFVNLVTLPYTLYHEGITREQTYTGETFEATYTAVPPLPPAAPPAEPAPTPEPSAQPQSDTPAPTETPAPAETPAPSETPNNNSGSMNNTSSSTQP